MANPSMPQVHIDGIKRYSSLILNNIRNRKTFIICDKNTLSCVSYLQSKIHLLKTAFVYISEDGERCKNLSSAQKIWDLLLENNANKTDLIINVGGGMISDLGGFVASTYKRGISYINIPTSLLGMIDASIGGKNGINYNHYKNQIGTFSNPDFIICDPHFLKTLPGNELLSGFAEALKHGLLFDKNYWQLCTSKPIDQLDFFQIIEKSIALKTKIVKKDPFEKNERKLLNLGHTVGHSLEAFFLQNKKPISHGLAVANGIVIESYFSTEYGLLKNKDFLSIQSAIFRLFDPIKLDEKDVSNVVDFIKKDKKNSSNKLNFTLLECIGKGKVDVQLSENHVQNLLAKFWK